MLLQTNYYPWNCLISYLQKVQNSLYKSQKKRPSIKDELTGQESEQEQDKVSEGGGVARDYTEQLSSVDGGMNDETNQEVFEFNADSDCDLQIYKVQLFINKVAFSADNFKFC